MTQTRTTKKRVKIPKSYCLFGLLSFFAVFLTYKFQLIAFFRSPSVVLDGLGSIYSGTYDVYCDRKWVSAWSGNCLCYAEYSGPNASVVDPRSVRCAMTFQPVGRLGNVIGQYVGLLVLSRFNRRPAFMTPEMGRTLSKYFPHLSIPVLNQEVYEDNEWTEVTLEYVMREAYKNISGLFVRLNGYPYSKTYFKDLVSEIRDEFRLKEEYKMAAGRTLAKIKKAANSSVTFVGVHVRRGDYVKHFREAHPGVLADRKYFTEAMDYFRERHSDAVFVVVSNDMKWCVDNIPNDRNDVHFAGTGNEDDPITDFALLVNCNHTVYTFGTYGFFAALFAGGDVVYFTNFTTNLTKESFYHYDTPLKHWHPIAADQSLLHKIADLN